MEEFVLLSLESIVTAISAALAAIFASAELTTVTATATQVASTTPATSADQVLLYKQDVPKIKPQAPKKYSKVT